MAHLTTDSPISRSIVRAFLDFLSSVEPAPGVDVEGLEVARECLTEVFKLNTSPTDVHATSVSLVDIFKSLESSKQCEASQSDAGKQPDDMDASGSSTAHYADHTQKHSEDEDWTRASRTFGVSKDELCGQFFNALEKAHFFRTNPDGTDDPVQLEKASRIFNDAVMEMERSQCQEFSLKNLAELLKSLGNKAMQSKRYPDAIDLYSCAIALCEENAVYYCNRAAAYTQIYKYTEAIQDCLKSIEIDPNYSKAYSRLGLAYYAQGNYRDAIDKGFRKALLLDPNNESIKENIRVAEQKLIEEQHRAGHSQGSRSSPEPQNLSAGGSRGNAAPPPFNPMPFNANDLASVFMNMATNTANAYQGQHPQERHGEDSNTNSFDEPEIRIGSNVNFNWDQMPEDLTGAFRSVMEMLGRGQQDHFDGRTAPN